MSLEQTLASWTAPSSSTEADKQDRTERMIREAIRAHEAFQGFGLSVYAKGSYPNNTNVRADSDVDVAVQCHDVYYFDTHTPEITPARIPYQGIWTPSVLRVETEAALRFRFGNQVDATSSTAIRVNSSTARIDADVTPCFDYRYYFSPEDYREGVKIFPIGKQPIVNYPSQHLDHGRAKNTATNHRFKQVVRIVKRMANAMSEDGFHHQVPSYFVECLVYNCPNDLFSHSTWTERVRQVITYVWQSLQGPEPSNESDRWLEVNECKYLFHSAQKWTRMDGREFALRAWKYFEQLHA